MYAGMMYSPSEAAAAAHQLHSHHHHSSHHAHHHHAAAAAAAAKMMMNSKPGLGSPLTSVSAAAAAAANCFGGRYSPTYRVPDQMRDPMRRCMTNPPVSAQEHYIHFEGTCQN